MRLALLALAFVVLVLAPSARAAESLPARCIDVPMAVKPGKARSIELRCTDPDGPFPVTFAVGEADDGTVTHRAAHRRTARYTPDPGFTGTDAFTVTIRTADGQTTELEQRIEVTDDQLAPVCWPSTAKRWAPSEAYVAVPCADPNEGDLVTPQIVGQPGHGTASIYVGAVVYKPESGYEGDDEVVLRASDGARFSAPVTVPIEVVAQEAPTCAAVATVPVRAGRPKELQLRCRDSSMSGFTTVISDRTDHGRLDQIANGWYRYIPDALHRGHDTATFRATNQVGDSEPVTVTFDVQDGVNEPPVCADNGAVIVRAGTSVEAPAWCSDADGDPVTIAVVTPPAHGTVSAPSDQHGKATYTAAAGHAGRDHFVLSASDGRTTTTYRRDVIVVAAADNTAPACSPVLGTGRNDSTATAVLACTDEEDDPLTYTVSDPLHGTLTRTATPYWLELSMDPDDDFVGTEVLTATASDGLATSNAVGVHLEIFAPSAPICDPLEPKRVRTGNFVHMRALCTDGFWPLDATPEVLPKHGTIESFNWGQYKYVPKPGYRGPDQFTLRVENRYGTVLLTQEIEVADDVNTPPRCSPFGSKTRTDTPLKVNFGCNDDEHDALAITVESAPANGTIGDWNEGNWGATYTPADGFAGTDEYTLRVDDGHGGVITVEHAITVFDPAVNEPPTCSGGAGWTKAGEPTGLQIWCNDPEDDPLTYTVVEQPGHGTLAGEPGEPLIYTPDEGFVGYDTATVEASDGRDITEFGVGMFVDPVAPVCTAIAATTAGAAKALTLDCRPGPGMPADHVVEIVTQPGHGTLGSLSGSAVTYTPANGYVGTDTFTYRARRGDLKSTVATATITVTAPPPPPDPEPDPDPEPEPEPEPEVDKPAVDEVVKDQATVTPGQRASPAPAAEAPVPAAPEQTPQPLGPLLTFRARTITANGKPARLATIRCPTACTATATPELLTVGRRTSRVRLPQRRLGLRAGASGTISVTLDRALRRRVAKARTATLVVRIEIRPASGASRVETLRIAVRRTRSGR